MVIYLDEKHYPETYELQVYLFYILFRTKQVLENMVESKPK